MNSILPFDELNKFKAALPQFFNADGKGIKSKKDYDSLLDMLEDLFLLAYASGFESTNLALSSNIEPTLGEVLDVVDKENLELRCHYCEKFTSKDTISFVE